MNSIVALPLAGVPTSSALASDALTRKPTKEELYAYAEWLSNERSVLMHELGEPERFSPVGTAAGMLAMVEKVATGALDMLTAARLPAVTPAEVIPFAPKLKSLTTASLAPSVGLADVLITDEMLKPEQTRQAVAQAMTNDTLPRAVPSRTSAVDRIKRHFLPAVTPLMRRPVDSVRLRTHRADAVHQD